MADANVGNITASLRIDSSEWVRGLTQATQQLAQFQQSVGRVPPALQQVQQGMTGIATATGQMAQQMQVATRATSGWSQALQVAGGIGLATSVGAMTSAIVAFGRETVQVGARLEQLRASLSAIAGSTAAGQQQFDSLFQTAQRLGVPFENLAQGWRRLTAAASQSGLALSDQRRLLEAVATEGRRVGASNDELNRAFQALGQMASKGVVSMEELRQQLGEALPTAFAAMARGMGITTEELNKLVETGTVRFPAAARALTRGLEEIQSQGGKTGETLTSAFNRFSNEVVRARDELMRMGGPLKTITDTATGFLKVLNDSAQAQRQLQTARAEEALIGTGLRTADVARLPAAQQQRITTLNRLLGEQVMQQGDPNAPPMFQPTREEYIKQLREELATLQAGAQAIKAKTDEQKAATAEVNKARHAEGIQRDTIEALTKQMDVLTKAQADFRAKAALAPETFGRPGSAEYLRGQQQALQPGVEKLAESLTRLPAGVQVPAELQARARGFDVDVGGLGRQLEGLQAKQAAGRKAETEAEQARKQAAREAEQAQEQYQNAIDKTRMALAQQQDTAVQTLARLADAYTRTGEAQDRVTAAKIAAQFPENEEIQRRAALVTLLSEEAEANKEAFNAIKQRTDALREAADAQQAFQNKLDAATARLQAPREERQEVTLRGEAAAQGIALTADQERQLQGLTRLRQEQARLTQAAEIWRDVSFGIGSAWSQALQSIAEHTKTVSEAFRAMGQAILQTFADIAAQQATQAFFKLGMGILTSALTGGAGAGLGGESASAVGAGINPIMFQHGGMVNRPTLAMLGESAAHNPEVVLNRQQLQGLFAGQAGGQGQSPGVTVINVASKAQAEQTAAQERAMGRTAVINFVLEELSTGESSRINRSLRALQR